MKRALKILTGLVVALAVAAIGVFAGLLVTAERPARPDPWPTFKGII